MKMTIWYVASNYNKEYLTYYAGPFNSYASAFSAKQEFGNDDGLVIVQSVVNVD